MPLWIFSTSEYDCLVSGASEGEVLEVYEQSGDEAKVWVNNYQMLGGDLVHFSFQARAAGGENDIENLLQKQGLEYVLLDWTPTRY